MLLVRHSSHCIVFDELLWAHKSSLCIVAWPLVIRPVLAHNILFLLFVYFLSTQSIFTDLLMVLIVFIRSSGISNCLQSLTLALILVDLACVSLLDLDHLGLIRFAATLSCKEVDLLVLRRVIGLMFIKTPISTFTALSGFLRVLPRSILLNKALWLIWLSLVHKGCTLITSEYIVSLPLSLHPRSWNTTKIAASINHASLFLIIFEAWSSLVYLRALMWHYVLTFSTMIIIHILRNTCLIFIGAYQRRPHMRIMNVLLNFARWSFLSIDKYLLLLLLLSSYPIQTIRIKIHLIEANIWHGSHINSSSSYR